jgi:alpha-glucosidase (family GH31 glycosyl hydrolase)
MFCFHLQDAALHTGDDVIVAPVVEQGARTRRLYLPVGRWSESNDAGGTSDGSPIMDGPCWVTVDAPLEKLPIFIRRV